MAKEPFDPASLLGDSDPSEDSRESDVEKAKSKLIMDFQLGQAAPEKITIEVLKKLIREKPDRISMAIRKWLHPGSE